MANVIKHKRGSGSDPVANDLVVGEVAIRTDVGKLFTKMDNGSVAEIAGGGSDIAINTLSSSSGTGGGSATFNGSAFRFTLSAPPSVSAQQLLVSINGVIQKPVAGTGQPSEGFSVDGTDIILGDAPAAGSDFFILTFKSLGVSEPADNSVTSAKIVDGAIVNADINASAAIAGTKISPDFGSQIITTTERVLIGTTTEGISNGDDLTIATSGHTGLTIRSGTSSQGNIFFSDGTSGADEYRGYFQYEHTTNALLFGTDATERMRIDSSGQVGIGTSSPAARLHVSDTYHFTAAGGNSTTGMQIGNYDGSSYGVLSLRGSTLRFDISNSEKMRIDSSGNVSIGSTTANALLDVNGQARFGGNKVTLDTDGSLSGKISNSTTRAFVLSNTDVNADFFGGRVYQIGPDGTTLIGGSAGTNPASYTSPNIKLNPSGSSFLNGGNVGIGTTSPSTALDVQGTIRRSAVSGGRYTDFVVDSAGSFIDASHFLQFRTNGASGLVNAMRIDSAGKVKINTDSTQGGHILSIKHDGAASLVLRRDTSSGGVANFMFGSSFVGSIQVNTGATSFVTSSDYRLKENATAISDAITRLKTLKPYRFNWKADKSKTVDGFFAHEVTAVPEAITGTKDEVDENNEPIYQGIDQSKLVPLLVAALQEAIGRIEALEAK